EKITTDDEELKSNSSKNYTDEENYIYTDEDNYNCINEDDSNYEELIFEISNKLKIPNNAFIDFMNVVDKYNISNKAGDAFLKVFKKYSSLDQNLLPKSTSAGRYYLRSINISTLKFKKDLVSTYNNTNYYFENRSILLAIQELLQNDNLMQQCKFNYKVQWKVDENNQRVQCYAEIYNANCFWKMSDINIYTATVPDRLHYLDIGLFYYQLKYSRMLLKEIGGNNAINEMDHQFGTIPPIHGLKIFKFGLQNIKRFTAGEYRNIMKVIPFIIDGILYT
ncbi:16405_t:CDS:2, partial [Dentiscutata erythropus]